MLKTVWESKHTWNVKLKEKTKYEDPIYNSPLKHPQLLFQPKAAFENISQNRENVSTPVE